MSTAFVNYDGELERQITSHLTKGQQQALLEWVIGLRESIAQHRLRRIASTRLVAGAAAALQAGKTLNSIKKRYFQNWTADEAAKVGA
jgi:hypothetical protein